MLRAVASSSSGSGGAAIGSAVTGGTPHSVLFIDATGNLGQDNNNFYFNDAASGSASAVQLSIGTSGDFTGTDTLNIYGQLDAYQPNSVVNGGAGQAANLLIDGLIPGVTASSSQGTGTSPVISNTGDFIGAFGAWMYTGVSPNYTPAAIMLGVASGATAANLGGQWQFWTKADNGVLTQRWTIGNDGGLVGTSAAAMSFAVGPNGATNPVFQVDSSVASQATGLVLQGKAAAASVTLSVTSTGTNEGLQINTKGSGAIFLQCGGTTRATIGTAQWLFSLLTPTSSVNTKFSVLNSADTGIVASTEAHFAYFNGANGARQHATGTLALQRDFRISGTTHTFAAASALTDLAAFSVDYGSVGGNVTCTNLHAIYIPTIAVTGLSITNSYGISANAATGATNNYAANLNGPVIHGGSLFYQTRSVTAAGAITVSAVTDYYIGVNKTVGAATPVNLPAGVTGLSFVIKDEKGDAATNNITITPAAGNIDNAATKVLNTNLQSVTVFYNGTQWTVN